MMTSSIEFTYIFCRFQFHLNALNTKLRLCHNRINFIRRFSFLHKRLIYTDSCQNALHVQSSMLYSLFEKEYKKTITCLSHLISNAKLSAISGVLDTGASS